jgi:hypothetical protein
MVVIYTDRMKIVVACSIVSLVLVSAMSAQPPATPNMVDTPGVKVLTGLTVPEFEAEMQTMTQALGVSCVFCHARGNFAAETNPRKGDARRMLEITKGINQQFFPSYKPADGESKLGRVTCFTCHQGAERPRTAAPQHH